MPASRAMSKARSNNSADFVSSTYEKDFLDIGRHATSMIPNDGSKQAVVAIEFCVAQQLRGLANDRYDAAKAALMKSGAFDVVRYTMPMSQHVVYSKNGVTISLQVKDWKGGLNVDGAKLAAALLAEFDGKKRNLLDQVRIRELIGEATKPPVYAHEYTANYTWSRI